MARKRFLGFGEGRFAWVLIALIVFLPQTFGTVISRNYCDLTPVPANTWVDINASFTQGLGFPPLIYPQCFSLSGDNITIDFNGFTITNGRGFLHFVGITSKLQNITITSSTTGTLNHAGMPGSLFSNLTGSVNVTVEKIRWRGFIGGFSASAPVENATNFLLRNSFFDSGGSTASYWLDLNNSNANVSGNLFWNLSAAASGNGDIRFDWGNESKNAQPFLISNNNFTRTGGLSGMGSFVFVSNTNYTLFSRNSFREYDAGASSGVTFQYASHSTVAHSVWVNTTLWFTSDTPVGVNDTVYNNTFNQNKTGTNTLLLFGRRFNVTYNDLKINTTDASTGALFALNDSVITDFNATGNNNNPIYFGGGANDFVYNTTVVRAGAVAISGGQPFIKLNNVFNWSFWNCGSLSAVASVGFGLQGTVTELYLFNSQYNNFTSHSFLFAGNYTINTSKASDNFFWSPAFAMATPVFTLGFPTDNFTVGWRDFLMAEYPNGTAVVGANLNLTSLNTSGVVISDCTTNSTGYCAGRHNVSQYRLGTCGLIIPFAVCWSPQFNNHSLQGSVNSKYNSSVFNVTSDGTLVLEIEGEVAADNPPEFEWFSMNFTNESAWSSPSTIAFFSNFTDDYGVASVVFTFNSSNYSMTLYNGTADDGVWNYNVSNLPAGTYYFNFTGFDGSFGNLSQDFSVVIAPISDTANLLLNDTDANFVSTFAQSVNATAYCVYSTPVLLRNGTVFSNPQILSLTPDMYNYTAYCSGDGVNVTSSDEMHYYTQQVGSGSFIIHLNSTPNNVSYQANITTVNVSCYLNVTPCDWINFFVNETHDSIQCGYVTYPWGWSTTGGESINFTCHYNGNMNYSVAEAKLLATGVQNIGSINLTLHENGTNGNYSLLDSETLNSTGMVNNSDAIVDLMSNFTGSMVLLDSGNNPVNLSTGLPAGYYEVNLTYNETNNFTWASTSLYVLVNSSADNVIVQFWFANGSSYNNSNSTIFTGEQLTVVGFCDTATPALFINGWRPNSFTAGDWLESASPYNVTVFCGTSNQSSYFLTVIGRDEALGGTYRKITGFVPALFDLNWLQFLWLLLIAFFLWNAFRRKREEVDLGEENYY